MSLQMRDCAVHSGWINLGEPHGQVIPPVFQPGWPTNFQRFCGPPIPCAVSLFNNVFDRVFINLDADTGPTWWSGPYTDPTIDLQLTATNNTFRGGWLSVEPINASAGNWVFENNFFDQTIFAQDQYQPLDYGYNAYWYAAGSDIGVGQTNRLIQSTNNDGYTDGQHEVSLSAAPVFTNGPLGNFYLDTTQSPWSQLYGAGWGSPADVGLFHFTSRVDQKKEGPDPAWGEPPGHNINIGAHYVALGSSGQPKDSDTDGIPDYVENWHGDGNYQVHTDTETDWQTAYTASGVFDPTNSIYADTDLEGDGLPGVAENLFGTNPLVSDNPLDLTKIALPRVFTGAARFPLPIPPALDGGFSAQLSVSGQPAAASVLKANSEWTVQWDTTLIANGVYWLGVDLVAQPEGDTITCPGKLVTVSNAICFPDGLLLAGDSLYINPQTVYANGTWAMQITDDQGNLFASLTGKVDANGFFIDPTTSAQGVSLSLLDDQGAPLPSDYYTAQITAYADPASGAPGGRGTGTKVFAVEKKWTRPGQWVIAYQNLFTGSSSGSISTVSIMSAAVSDVYGNNAFKGYTPPVFEANLSAGENGPEYTVEFLGNTASDWANFVGYLLQSGTRNLFYLGHCDITRAGGTLGNSGNPSQSTDATYLESTSVLNNTNNPNVGLLFRHPYRFVFICGCSSAKTDLPIAFGIPKVTMPSAQFANDYGLSPRAFLGFDSDNGFASKVDSSIMAGNLAAFLTTFWSVWTTPSTTGQMQTLQQAVDAAKKADDQVRKPLFEKKLEPHIFGCPDLYFNR
ncbi:MAG: hypothetical protein C5B50_14940 [Verrucomicrobia bacterium]|nr:MAG: hypothetical protein C5B50_14940 [Verrucomicrobiota bacterium]